MINIHLLFPVMMGALHRQGPIRYEGSQAMPSSKKDNAPAESQRNPLGRRLLVLNLAAAPALLGVARSGAAELLQQAPAIPVATDADPGDGPGRGRGRARGTGLTDSDPGNGRGTQRKAMTDSDPRDEAGRGRRGT
jgi:hypothetical protein